MASIAAQEVAKDVVGMVGKGKIPNITRLAVKRGYSFKTADKGKVQKTKSYQAIIQPFVEKLISHRDRIIERMEKTVNKARYNDLSASLERVSKQIQLATGGATENIAIGVKKLKDEELQALAEGDV